MVKAVRIPLDVPQEFADDIDRAVAYLALETGKRQTRTSFIKQAIQIEVERLTAVYGAMAKRSTSKAKTSSSVP